MSPDLLPYRFRWVFCQLEVLRHCLPASIRQTLDQLPESLDATYLHVLSQIPQANQAHAHRLLQCLMVAVRPLSVEELAEVLAFEFAAQGVIPKYRVAWQLDNQTEAVLSTCSSLVAIVIERWTGRQVVQFSHFSVKEFLMSNRLGNFSRYHIHPISAHTILTQACLGVLLHLDDRTRANGLPLAEYAAQHWVAHARFEDVASRVKDGMETLFDSDKPHFAAWVKIYDMDYNYSWRFSTQVRTFPEPEQVPLKPKPNPLYYSVLCGFYDLTKHLAIKRPQHVNAISGIRIFPLLVALCEENIELVELLLELGANVDARDTTGETILLRAFSLFPRLDLYSIVRLLVKYGADLNARDKSLRSSLHLAEYTGWLEVAEMLVKHQADVNSQDNNGKTPLHILSECGTNNEDDVLKHARLLLEHGAEVNRRDNNGMSPLRILLERQICEKGYVGDSLDFMTLWEHGAKINKPLHLETGTGMYEFA